MHPKGLLASFFVFASFGIASAQPVPVDPPPPVTEPAPPPPPTTSTTMSTSTSAPAPPANENDSLGTAFGVGAHAMLTGASGPAVVYNNSRFHIEGLFTYAEVNDQSSFVIGGRAWLHIHKSPRAELSLGGGGGIQNVEVMDPARPGESDTNSNLLIEGGAQIRFFATRNVALSASMGLGIIGGDGDSMAVVGQVTGAFGVTYFLF